MDEADRMIDMGFEEDVRAIMSHFKVSPARPAAAWVSSPVYRSTNAKPFSSPRLCLERSKISPNNRLSTPSSLT